MFYGVEITSGPEDWQVLQRRDGEAQVSLKGRWQLEMGAIRAGVSSARPVIRVLSETDQSQVIPWTPCGYQTGGDRLTGEDVKGEWGAELTLPQGGPYRLETSLDAVSRSTGEHWMFRGDIRVHIGVGDVFCMAGQSNAAGYAKGWAYDPPDVRVSLKRNSGKWDMAAHPMNDATGASDCLNAPMGITGTSPFLSFGRRYADLSGVPVGLIQAAQGGSPMKRWDPERDGDLYRNMLDKITSVGGVRAIMWYQGCADADGENAAVYRESFRRMVTCLRTECGYQVPFFTMQLNRYDAQPDGDAWGVIKEAQRRAALEIPGVWLMPTSCLSRSDEIHNSASGNVVLGQMLAKQAYGALCGGAPFEAPSMSEIRKGDGGLIVLFRNAGDLSSLRPPRDPRDFVLTDEDGKDPVKSVSAEGDRIVLVPERPCRGKAFLSYGCDPAGPSGEIVDKATYLPIIPFYRAEVTE